MTKSQLTAQKRNTSLNPRQLRSSGKLPATLYGQGIDSVSLELDTKEFITTYKKDKFAIFELKVGKETFNAIVKKVQTEFTTDNALNVEFQNIRENATVKITVPVKVVGVSPAVKMGGELSINLTEMEVECLPADMPHSIDVDVTVLAEIEDSITISQVVYPKGVKPVEDPKMLVVKVVEPKTAEEIEAEEAKHAAMPQQGE